MTPRPSSVRHARDRPGCLNREGRGVVCQESLFRFQEFRVLHQLFSRIYPGLVRFLYRRVWDLDIAEDLAQEAFVRLLDARPRNPEAWLFTVAGNLAKNSVRGESRQRKRLSLIAADPAEPTLGADQHLVQQEAVSQVRRALEMLSDRDRTLLVLHADSMAYKGLAAIIGVKPSSIAPLLARARGRFLRSMARVESQDATSHLRESQHGQETSAS